MEDTMKSRLFVVLGIVLVLGVGILLLVPPARFLVLGKLRGEPFHGGWPTSYWVHILKSGTSQQRVNAAQTLSEIGPATPEVVPALIAALADE